MAMNGQTPLPPGIALRAKTLGNLKLIAPPAATPQKIPASSLWYENNTLYLLTGVSSGYPVGYASIGVYYAACSAPSTDVQPFSSSIFPPGITSNDVAGCIAMGKFFYQLSFACRPALAGQSVPIFTSIIQSWIIQKNISISGLSNSNNGWAQYSPQPGFGPICPGLGSQMMALSSSGYVTVNVAYVLTGPPQKLSGGADWPLWWVPS